jgi:DMSO/TMAO reductase YedYZ heme-binding membrane subunit
MGNLIIGKHSALFGFALFFVCILSLITAVWAAIAGFHIGKPVASPDAFLGIVAIITLLVWIGIVIFAYQNFDKLKKGFSHENE